MPWPGSFSSPDRSGQVKAHRTLVETVYQVYVVRYIFLPLPCSGELRTQKLKSHLVRTQSLNVLPLKPGVSQYIAILSLIHI